MTCTVAVMIEFSKNNVYWQRRLMLLVVVLLMSLTLILIEVILN